MRCQSVSKAVRAKSSQSYCYLILWMVGALGGLMRLA